jgi:hypothetical protein
MNEVNEIPEKIEDMFISHFILDTKQPSRETYSAQT